MAAMLGRAPSAGKRRRQELPGPAAGKAGEVLAPLERAAGGDGRFGSSAKGQTDPSPYRDARGPGG